VEDHVEVAGFRSLPLLDGDLQEATGDNADAGDQCRCVDASEPVDRPLHQQGVPLGGAEVDVGCRRVLLRA
jgi:hypothetical protein